ncbi:hypothetical protein [Massilia sp. CT11-137]|uniref:hypothetical protein n=1 Tax=Massilia sp. CT11-137 TaxID=3393901 RepID=UPI0039A47815
MEPNIKRLAAIAYGEASTLNDPDEISGIAFAVSNRARAWGKKTVDELIQADPNYTYAINGKNRRYERFMKTKNTDEIAQDSGMKLALEAAVKAWTKDGPDPSNGAYWWDGLDFKTNYANHPKVKDGFRFGDPSHNIFSVEEKLFERILYWKVRNRRTGEEVNSKERGRFSAVWRSTAAHGKTIFWLHDSDYLTTSGGKAYR